MINSIEDLRSAGVLPTGPVSAWPKERNVAGPKMQEPEPPQRMPKRSKRIPSPEPVEHDTKVTAGVGQMAAGVVQNALRAVRSGKVPDYVREERLATCKTCPHYIEKSKRCSACGCYLPAKSWINHDPDELCPKQKWRQ